VGTYANKIVTPLSITQEEWTNIQITWDGTIAKLYINSILIETNPSSGFVLNDNLYAYRIGWCWNNTPAFVTGEIGEVRMYDYPIDQAKVTSDYLESSLTFLDSTIPLPTQPTNLTSSSVTDIAFTVSWTGGTGAISYTYTINGNSVSPSTNNGLVNKSAIFSGLQKNTTYSVIVRASNSSGTTVSSSLDVTTLDSSDSPGVWVRPLVTSTEVTLNWNHPYNPYGYQLEEYIISCNDNTFSSVTLPGNLTSYVITGLTQFSAYTFEIVAKYINGIITPPGIYRTVIPSVRPLCPISASSSPMNQDGTTIVSWVPAENYTVYGYAVVLISEAEEVISNSAYSFATSLEISGLDTSKVYTCNVYAVNDVGWSNPPAVANPVTI